MRDCLQREWFARSRAHRMADAEWSSIVGLPNDIVINAQLVENKTGSRDRLKVGRNNLILHFNGKCSSQWLSRGKNSRCKDGTT